MPDHSGHALSANTAGKCSKWEMNRGPGPTPPCQAPLGTLVESLTFVRAENPYCPRGRCTPSEIRGLASFGLERKFKRVESLRTGPGRRGGHSCLAPNYTVTVNSRKTIAPLQAEILYQCPSLTLPTGVDHTYRSRTAYKALHKVREI